MDETETRLSRSEAVELIAAALAASNTSANNARSVAEALVAAEVDGQSGHGFSRVAAYVAQARSGKVDGQAEAQVARTAPAYLWVDARNGFAYPAIDRAISALGPLAAETGIAAAGITRSHHCGQLARHVERLAEAGHVALMVSNTPKAMAPWGGRAPLFGTNPIAFAAPRPDAPPIVLDLSLSKVARGKVMAAAQRGEAIPEGWALDADGQPTTDAKAALAGTMLPLGGAKGAGLALMVEVLAGCLTGANPSFAATSFFDAEGDPPGVGHLMIAIDPARTAPGYGQRIATLAEEILKQEGTRLPGGRLQALRAERETGGIPITAARLAEIRALTRENLDG